MPLPPVDEDGEMVINLRDKFAPWEKKLGAGAAAGAASAGAASVGAEVETAASEVAETTGLGAVSAADVMAEMPEVAPEMPTVVMSGASERLKAKAAAVGLAAKARAAAMTDKIRQNPAAAIAGLAGAAVVVALVVLTFVWTKSAGDVVAPDKIAGVEEQEQGPELPEGDNSAEVDAKISDLVCRADFATDKMYGFKGFTNMAVERRITFTAQNVPDELFTTNIFSFGPNTFKDQAALNKKIEEYKRILNQKFPENKRGFLVRWGGSKSGGIQMSLSTKLMNSQLDDAQLAQFGLVPDRNPDGSLTANYKREDLEQRWKAEGFRCDAPSDTVAQK